MVFRISNKICLLIWTKNIRIIALYILVLTFLAIVMNTLSFIKSDTIIVNSFNYLQSNQLLNSFIEKDDLARIASGLNGFNSNEILASFIRQASLYAYALQGVPNANWSNLASTTDQYDNQLKLWGGSSGLVNTHNLRAKKFIEYLEVNHRQANLFLWISIISQLIGALYAIRIICITETTHVKR